VAATIHDAKFLGYVRRPELDRDYKRKLAWQAPDGSVILTGRYPTDGTTEIHRTFFDALASMRNGNRKLAAYLMELERTIRARDHTDIPIPSQTEADRWRARAIIAACGLVGIGATLLATAGGPIRTVGGF